MLPIRILLRSIWLVYASLVVLTMFAVCGMMGFVLIPIHRRFANRVISWLWSTGVSVLGFFPVGRRVIVDDRTENLDPSRVTIVIANHLDTPEVPGKMRALVSKFPFATFYPTFKAELMKGVFGWIAYSIGGIGLDRQGGSETITRLKGWAEGIQTVPGSVVVIFLDGTRGDEERRKAQREKLLARPENADLHDVIIAITDEVMPPKAGGLWALLSAIENPQVVLMSNAYPSKRWGVGRLFTDKMHHVHSRFESVKLPTDMHELRPALLRLWAEKVLPHIEEVRQKA